MARSSALADVMRRFRAMRLRRRRSEALILGIVVLMSVVAVKPAVAAPYWSRPTVVARTLCPNGFGTSMRAAQNARGDVLVAWIERGCGVLRNRWRLVTVSGRVGRRFGRPRLLASGEFNANLELGTALDARGGATIAWTRARRSHNGGDSA